MANDRLEWVARSLGLGATFVDSNSWIRDLDFGRDGLHLNKTGARELGELYSRVCGIDSGSREATDHTWRGASSLGRHQKDQHRNT